MDQIEGKTRGRPKKKVMLSNGVVSEDTLFNFVPRNTLPKNDVFRFITLCDAMITDLGADDLSNVDIEEIALYYRDKIYCDQIYREFATAETTDGSLVVQIEKLNKNIEKRKENLGARFIDKGKKRQDSGGESLMDLLSIYASNVKEAEALADKKQLEINNNKDTKYTKIEEYMESHISRTDIDRDSK